VVSGQWSVVSGQWSVVSGQWSVVSGQINFCLTSARRFKAALGYLCSGLHAFRDTTLSSKIMVEAAKGAFPFFSGACPLMFGCYPKAATHTKWKYRVMYRIDDAQFGPWSTEVSATVGG
jgi:hypothetical protein